MKIGYFTPSYNRPEKSITQAVYPGFKLVVRESEVDEYRSNGNDVVVCPDEAQGNLCRIKNWIFENLMGDNDAVVMLDDDCRGLFWWRVHEEGAEKVLMDMEDLQEFCESSALMCEEWGFKFWGVNCIGDKGAYREYTPFSTLNYIGGPFHCILKGNECRYDEELSLRDDYDFTLQNIFKYRGCLRMNMVTYDAKQSEQEGGCAGYRNVEEEKRQFYLLQKKWGSSVVRRDMKSKREFDYNPILKIPLKGV